MIMDLATTTTTTTGLTEIANSMAMAGSTQSIVPLHMMSSITTIGAGWI